MSTNLVHTSSIEPHDGGVCQAIKHRAQGFLGVEWLRFEQLLNKSLMEHRGHNVMEN